MFMTTLIFHTFNLGHVSSSLFPDQYTLTPFFPILHFYTSLKITAQKMKFSIKELVTSTEEILNGKLHFLFSEYEKSVRFSNVFRVMVF